MNTETYIQIKQYIADITKGTEFENNVYAVGGCVRDFVMDCPIKDVDLVVSMENGGIRFANWLNDNGYTKGSIVIYERFGTACFRLSRFPSEDLEVVQTRKESYNDISSRNPDTEYGTIEDDCMRRDLTINALYCRLSDDKIIDVCGHGLEDIKNKVIDTPTAPDVTYTDDPLRILRCIRFATRFGEKWTIQDRVMESMTKNVHRLDIISKERIHDEFVKIVGYAECAHGLAKIYMINAMSYIMPDMIWDDDRFAMIDEACKKDMPLLARLAIMFNGIESLADKLSALKFSNDDIKQILEYIRLYNKWIVRTKEMSSSSDLATLMEFEYDAYTEKIFDNVVHMIGLTDNYAFMGLMYAKEHARKNGNCMFEFKLPINGEYLIKNYNMKPGKKIKDMFDILLAEAFKNPKMAIEDYDLIISANI